jgi:hypothetical protein
MGWAWVVSSVSSSRGLGSSVETNKEHFMNKQTGVNTASKKMGGRAPAAGSPVAADNIARKGGSAGQLEPASVKTGHDTVKAGSRSLKVGHD